MKIPFNSRSWHSWAAIFLSLPILLVAVTSLLMTHGQALGFREKMVSVGWLPGYAETPVADPTQNVRALLSNEAGLWIGTSQGLFLKTDTEVLAPRKFSGQEIRGLINATGGPFVLTQQGLWGQREGEWVRINQGPVFNAFAADGALYTLSPREGMCVSRDGGQTWENAAALAEALAAAPAPTSSPEVSLARLIRDLHTGAALLGRSGEWVWVDLTGITLGLLVLTGMYIWWGTQKRKRAAKMRKQEVAMSVLSN